MRLSYGLASLIAAACLVAAFAFPFEGSAIDSPPGAFVSAAVDATAPDNLFAPPEHPAVIGVECFSASVPSYTLRVSIDGVAGSTTGGYSDIRAGGRDGSGGIAGA